MACYRLVEVRSGQFATSKFFWDKPDSVSVRDKIVIRVRLTG